jgi:AcrR family transcriptional regulator
VIEAAIELFAERGYDATTTEAILARSGVSKGAMYHHFPGKLELFEAVYIQLEDEAMADLAAQAEGETALAQLRSGGRAYLRESGRDSVWARINLTQARSVLGLDRWRELAGSRGLAVVALQLRLATEAGEIAPVDIPAAAEIYLAALIEAGLRVERADDKAEAEATAGLVLDRLLDGLAAGPAHG